MGISYGLLDVFSPTPYGGNSIPVFVDAGDLTGAQMLAITRELRHFEASFVQRAAERRASIRVFDLIAELPFAGHPLLGAAAHLYRLARITGSATWTLQMGDREISVRIERGTGTAEGALLATMDQGVPQYLGEFSDRARVAATFGLAAIQLRPDLPVEVVSTGLRYLVVPLTPGSLASARVVVDLTSLVSVAGADFAVLFDPEAAEIRHWNNDGVLEDAATGSAAGTIGAYAARHGLARERLRLSQGRFVGRPSSLEVRISAVGRVPGRQDGDVRIAVGGFVSHVGAGVLEVLP